MFERFTDRARRSVVLAQDESRALGHSYIGTEHLLAGLISEGEGVASQVLTGAGVTHQAVHDLIVEIVGSFPTYDRGHIPFSPRCKKAIEYALREALQLGCNYIGTEHLLLGLLRDEVAVAVQLLTKLGATTTDLRRDVLTVLGVGSSQRPNPLDELSVHLDRIRHALTEADRLLAALKEEP